MSEQTLAGEATKNKIEDTVNWYLSDKLQDPMVPIATKKYLTVDNVLIHLTQCTVADMDVPRIKVQVFNRIDGGVRESSYQIFSDHRMTKNVNEMIFGNKAATAADVADGQVTETEAGELLKTISQLGQAHQTF